MIEATHVYCANCRAIQPVEFERFLATEPTMGTAARCSRCGFLAFTMISEARVYCDVCDDVRPARQQKVARSQTSPHAGDRRPGRRTSQDALAAVST